MGFVLSKDDKGPIKKKFFSENNKNQESDYDDEVDSVVGENNIIEQDNNY
jgi:hypothetical protein